MLPKTAVALLADYQWIDSDAPPDDAMSIRQRNIERILQASAHGLTTDEVGCIERFLHRTLVALNIIDVILEGAVAVEYDDTRQDYLLSRASPTRGPSHDAAA